MFQLLIRYCFYALFFVTPLLWSSANYELFEFNKMIFVYFLTVVIATLWALRMLVEKTLFMKKTPLDIPILLFLGANILSAIFSIDPHTSVWGYYSRSNGGLLSTISYVLLFYALVSNLESKDVNKLLFFGVLGGLAVALYAIPEHFGVSPSCMLLRGQLNASCWVQNVQARVFATLGQPNWLAAYLGMLVFPALYFFLTASSRILHTAYYILLLILYLAFTFTYSQGATLGILAGAVVFLIFAAFNEGLSGKTFGDRFLLSKRAFLVVLVFLLINAFFGSALNRLNLSQYLVKQNQPLSQSKSPDPRESSNAAAPSDTAASPAPSVNQLENGGTDSGKIRLIVWEGAIDIFKHFLVFGSGVETFAYAYYQFRPEEHNLVSEWDFLYNKAHNEYLNYLATTGLAGFLSYMSVIASFIIWTLRSLALGFWQKNKTKPPTTYYLLLTTILASYVFYLVQNFFGFSVVIVALFFYAFPGLSFVATGSLQDLKIKKLNFFFEEPLRNIFIVATICLGAYGIYSVSRVWVADTLFADGSNYSEAGSMTRAYTKFSKASQMRPDEPLYRSELGFAASSVAALAQEQDASLSAQLKDIAVEETEKAMRTSPKNLSLLRTAIRTYYQLTPLEKSFEDKTLQVADKAIALAPTDAKLYYNKGLILGQIGKIEEGIKALEKAVELKANYREGYLTLGDFYKSLDKQEKAKLQYETVLKLVPNDPEAMEKIKNLNED